MGPFTDKSSTHRRRASPGSFFSRKVPQGSSTQPIESDVTLRAKSSILNLKMMISRII
jgi:hypothetical protein